MTAQDVRDSIAGCVIERIERGLQPLRAIVGLRAWRLLLDDQGLEPRSIGKTKADSVRFRIYDFDLPVDADRVRAPGDELVTAATMERPRPTPPALAGVVLPRRKGRKTDRPSHAGTPGPRSSTLRTTRPSSTAAP